MSLRRPQPHRSPLPRVLSAAVLLGAAATVWLATDLDHGDRRGQRASPPPPAAVAADLSAPAPPALPPGPGHLVAHVRRATFMSSRPAQHAVARLLPHTEFGTPRVLSVVRREGTWLGVVAEERPNGRLGWVHLDTNLHLTRVRHTVDVYLHRRELVLRRDGRPVARFVVAVGAPGTPTPRGRFTVTDRLINDGASAYGCCVLALSGHQPYIEPGWSGGNRIAIHATADPGSVGQAVSHGCLRATSADMRRLVARTPPGTLVKIHP